MRARRHCTETCNDNLLPLARPAGVTVQYMTLDQDDKRYVRHSNAVVRVPAMPCKPCSLDLLAQHVVLVLG